MKMVKKIWSKLNEDTIGTEKYWWIALQNAASYKDNVVGHNFTVAWNTTPRANGYILEEDTNWSFDAPVEVYNGSQLTIELSGKDNATYYYRLKAFNEYSYSNWSDTVEIIVDWQPAPPTGLAAIQPTGHTINLIWPPHPDQCDP